MPIFKKHKKFFITADDIRDIATGRGSCLATDSILVGGGKVGYMYRDDPDNEYDSGWRFFAAADSDEYVNNPKNVGIYDVNTLANYDGDIIPHLDSPFGSVFERDEKTGQLVLLEKYMQRVK